MFLAKLILICHQQKRKTVFVCETEESESFTAPCKKLRTETREKVKRKNYHLTPPFLTLPLCVYILFLSLSLFLTLQLAKVCVRPTSQCLTEFDCLRVSLGFSLFLGTYNKATCMVLSGNFFNWVMGLLLFMYFLTLFIVLLFFLGFFYKMVWFSFTILMFSWAYFDLSQQMHLQFSF